MFKRNKDIVDPPVPAVLARRSTSALFAACAFQWAQVLENAAEGHDHVRDMVMAATFDARLSAGLRLRGFPADLFGDGSGRVDSPYGRIRLSHDLISVPETDSTEALQKLIWAWHHVEIKEAWLTLYQAVTYGHADRAKMRKLAAQADRHIPGVVHNPEQRLTGAERAIYEIGYLHLLQQSPKNADLDGPSGHDAFRLFRLGAGYYQGFDVLRDEIHNGYFAHWRAAFSNKRTLGDLESRGTKVVDLPSRSATRTSSGLAVNV
jgi:hypothetical protein